MRYSISNLYEELEGRYRFLDRSKLKRSLIEEFGLLEQKKNRYQYYGLKRAEKTLEGTYYPENENTYHFIFKREMFVNS